MKKQLLSIFALFAASFATAQSIPNGGFENWTTPTCQNPQHYFSSSLQQNNGGISPVNVIKTTDSYADSFAVKLTTTTSGGSTYPAYCANGDPSHPAGQGIPFSQQPTSLRLYYKCNVMTGDTALVFIMFKKAGVTISQNIYKITGTKASYTLLSMPLNLVTAPDSLIFGLTASNILTGGSFHGIAGSMLQVDSVSFTGIVTQPANLNGDFENWYTFSAAPTLNNWNISGSNTLNQTVDAFAGSFALELKTNETNNAHDTAYTSSATTGIFQNNITVGGYPYTTQVDAFKFHYKYAPADVNDSAMVLLQFKKAGVFFTGGSITTLLPASATYTAVSIPTNLPQVPDSVIVFFSSSKNFAHVPYSYLGADLKVDNVYFNSQATPVTNFSVAAQGCIGQAIQLTDLSANIPTTWTWTATGGNLSSSSAQNPTVTYTANGTYTISLIAGNAGGNGSVFSNTITINATPGMMITGNTTICNGQSTVLSGSGASIVSYTWTAGPTTQSYTVSPTSMAVYTLTGTDANNCTNTQTATVTVNALPTLTITSTSGYSVCPFTLDTLKASGTATSYTWSPGTHAVTNYTVHPNNTTTYTLTGVDANGCTNQITQLITVYPRPTLTITPSVAPICAGTTTTLSVITGSITITTYSWSTSATTPSISVNPIITTTYVVNGYDAMGCRGASHYTLTVNPLPTVIANSDTICSGNSVTLIANGASTYTWTGGPVSQTYTVSPTSLATYTVTGTSANNCTNTATATVTVNALPAVTITSLSPTLCVNGFDTIVAQGANTYSWSTGSTAGAITVLPASTITYTVTGTDFNGCSNTATISAINCGIGIQQYNGNSNTVTVYPNPNKGIFVVTTTQQANKIVVSDILGNELFTVTPTDNTTTISLNAQANGIYFVKIISDNTQTVKRIVINN